VQVVQILHLALSCFFMSCNFMICISMCCNVVLQFYVLHFRPRLDFYGPSFSDPALSVDTFICPSAPLSVCSCHSFTVSMCIAFHSRRNIMDSVPFCPAHLHNHCQP